MSFNGWHSLHTSQLSSETKGTPRPWPVIWKFSWCFVIRSTFPSKMFLSTLQTDVVMIFQRMEFYLCYNADRILAEYSDTLWILMLLMVPLNHKHLAGPPNARNSSLFFDLEEWKVPRTRTFQSEWKAWRKGESTFVKPISCDFSRKHWRQMLREYLRIRPALWAQTRLINNHIIELACSLIMENKSAYQAREPLP